MNFVDLLGWLGGALTLAVYSMKTMLPLRVAGVGANLAFIGFGYFAGIWPTFVLHCLLLPLNGWRLLELLRNLDRVKRVRRGEPALDWVAQYQDVRRYRAGEIVFGIGEEAGTLCYVKRGRVRMQEIGKIAGEGDIFGEVAFFTEARRRTATAICETDCEILEIDEESFLRLFYQNPAFGLFMTRLVAGRLAEATEEVTQGRA